ncbi:MAG: putative Uracil-DNA glycosylase [Akkermansiaceae bacterium]|nr:putative Uracil-DNA glycosylase [Akkermansiaceae bacterium]
MKQVDPGRNFADWREAARSLLESEVPPAEVIWERPGQGSLFGAAALAPPPGRASFKVPAEFVELARSAICHADPRRWALLYRILWRLVKGGEKHLLEIVSDPDIARARLLAKNVRREIHKMHAFVRFRKIGETDAGRERYVAWFEPDHEVIAAATPFFRDRFANMDWSIFSPKGCAHWIDNELKFTPGVATNPCDNPDELEEIWRTYYRSIFNPARLKEQMMKSEMPKRYWKNLPEASLIPELIESSCRRVDDMLVEPERGVRPAPNNRYLKGLQEMSAPFGDGTAPLERTPLADLSRMVDACRACPLWERATCAVFGRGPENARLMIVGEQPGDQEDLRGQPFVGPAGQFLDRALAEAKVDRASAYVTNAVKHFKWEPRGKLRLHKNPGRAEVEACKPWLLAELNTVGPAVLILLGGTAAASLLGPQVKVTQHRGLVAAPHLAAKVILTVHPSYLLRIPDPARKEEEYQRFVADLSLACEPG